MGSTYFLSIENDDTSTTLAMAYGDLAEVSFIARRQLPKLADSSARFSVTLVETQEIGQLDDDSNLPTDVRREVTAFTGKGKQAAMVLKSELADERKQAAAEQEQGESDNAADTQQF